jgi:transcription initiation factor TFIIIB Brf1 subunit/transcription initiation factor TFIIB
MADLFPALALAVARADEMQLSTSALAWLAAPVAGAVDAAADAAPPAPAASTSHVCRGCGSGDRVQTLNSRVLCTGCGTLLEFALDQGAEYRWFGSEDRGADPTRVGAPQNPLLPESSLGTTILLKRGHSAAMRRVKKYHSWHAAPYRERTLWQHFETISLRAAQAGVSPGVAEEAKELYAHASRVAVCRGSARDALLAACLFEALKRAGSPRRPHAVAEAFGVAEPALVAGIKALARLLQTPAAAGEAPPAAAADAAAAATALAEARRQEWSARRYRTTTFHDFVEPALAKLAPPKAQTAALRDLALLVGGRADDLGVVPETTPPSLAAAALSLAAAHLGVRGADVAAVAAACEVSAATILKCLKRLAPWHAQLVAEA